MSRSQRNSSPGAQQLSVSRKKRSSSFRLTSVIQHREQSRPAPQRIDEHRHLRQVEEATVNGVGPNLGQRLAAVTIWRRSAASGSRRAEKLRLLRHPQLLL
jgi:hypothetical protein